MKREPKRWHGVYDKCDICHGKIKDADKWFVDGKTIYGPWGLMCSKCFEKVGTGLGYGRGQKYDAKTAVLIEGDREF